MVQPPPNPIHLLIPWGAAFLAIPCGYLSARFGANGGPRAVLRLLLLFGRSGSDAMRRHVESRDGFSFREKFMVTAFGWWLIFWILAELLWAVFH